MIEAWKRGDRLRADKLNATVLGITELVAGVALPRQSVQDFTSMELVSDSGSPIMDRHCLVRNVVPEIPYGQIITGDICVSQLAMNGAFVGWFYVPGVTHQAVFQPQWRWGDVNSILEQFTGFPPNSITSTGAGSKEGKVYTAMNGTLTVGK